MNKENKKIEVILIESINENKSSYDVAKKLEVSQTTVMRLAKKHGLKFKGKSKWIWNKRN
jgi:DNA-binding MurR/RpiR family transcriptional regulator